LFICEQGSNFRKLCHQSVYVIMYFITLHTVRSLPIHTKLINHFIPSQQIHRPQRSVQLIIVYDSLELILILLSFKHCPSSSALHFTRRAPVLVFRVPVLYRTAPTLVLRDPALTPLHTLIPIRALGLSVRFRTPGPSAVSTDESTQSIGWMLAPHRL